MTQREKEEVTDQLDHIKSKLLLMYEIGKISAYQYGQLTRYYEERYENKNPYLKIKKRKNKMLKNIVDRLNKELEQN